MDDPTPPKTRAEEAREMKKSLDRLSDVMLSGLAMTVAATTVLLMVAVPGILLYWGLRWLWAALPWPS
jgi:hypothetical protein